MTDLKYHHIKSLFQERKSLSGWVGMAGLIIGFVLLLLSVQMYMNIQMLMAEKAVQKSGEYDYISVSKTITNENMGRDNRFTAQDIQLLRGQHDIVDVAPVYSNQFRAMATAGNVLPFSTDLFLESINKSFLDTLPVQFTWQPGQEEVPVIFSSDFLEMYNVFAPSQGLPQVSAQTISSVNIFLECSGSKGSKNFKASIVGLSDRINSILVPESFLKWGNYTLSGDTSGSVSRVFIKTKDANNPELIHFLEQNNFHINKDKVRFGRIKGVLQNAIATIGAFGVLVILLAIILFGFYMQLIIARSKENINLLLLLGYSPKWLARSFTLSYLPLYSAVVLIAVLISSIAQYLFSSLAFAHSAVSPYLSLPVWATTFLLISLILLMNIHLVRKEINKFSV